MPSNLRRSPFLKRKFQEKEFCKQIHFTARKIHCCVSEATGCFRDFRRVEINTSNLRRALIFSSEKCEERFLLDPRSFGILHSVKSQKGVDLIYTAAEA
jgi:hypothetical protein